MASVTFTGPNGSDPVAAIRQLRATALPTESDARAALDAQRERIVKRTESGVDAFGAGFTPYSSKYAQRLHRDPSAVTLGGAHGRILSAIEVITEGIETSHEMSLRIAGDKEAMIARVQNEGATIRSRLGTGKGKPKKNGKATFQIPARHFFEATEDDIRSIEDDLIGRINARLQS